MNISKEQLVSVCLGLANLVNKSISGDFLKTRPTEIDLNYDVGNLHVSFRLAEKEEDKNDRNRR